QISTNRKRQIERHVEDVLLSETFPCQLLSGKRRRGNKDLRFRELALKRRDQPGNREHFSHRDGMNPDRLVLASGQCKTGWHRTKTFLQPCTILSRTCHSHQPIRKAND